MMRDGDDLDFSCRGVGEEVSRLKVLNMNEHESVQEVQENMNVVKSSKCYAFKCVEFGGTKITPNWTH